MLGARLLSAVRGRTPEGQRETSRGQGRLSETGSRCWNSICQPPAGVTPRDIAASSPEERAPQRADHSSRTPPLPRGRGAAGTLCLRLPHSLLKHPKRWPSAAHDEAAVTSGRLASCSAGSGRRFPASWSDGGGIRPPRTALWLSLRLASDRSNSRATEEKPRTQRGSCAAEEQGHSPLVAGRTRPCGGRGWRST